MSTLLLLLALAVGETSNHRDIVLAYDQAVTRCHERGLNWKRVQPLVAQYRETDVLTVITKEVQVICTGTPTIRIQITWAAVEGADHYEVHIGGEIYISETTLWSRTFPAGDYSASVIPVDTQGNKGEPIPLVDIPVWNSQ